MAPVRRAAVIVVAASAVACAHYQHYQPAPVVPVHETARYRARRLGEPALTAFLANAGMPVNDSGWTSLQLAFVALYYRADLVEARDLLAAARAGELTARARPSPAVEVSVERAQRADEGKSTPWTFSLTTGLTFELGGKRSARIARAQAGTIAARIRMRATAWQIAQRAREAAIAVVSAERELVDQSAEAGALRTLAQLLRARYGQGQISLTEVARADADVQSAAVEGVRIARAETESRLALGEELAVPIDVLDSLRVRPDEYSACTVLDSLSEDSLDVLALRTRDDVGAALADYAVAESDLRLEIARQYPDLTIGPGILWDEGIRRWLLSLATPGIPLHTRGPIAEAHARRAAQAARVTLVEDSVLATVDSAVAACRGLGSAVAAADSLVAVTGRGVELADGAFRRGEVGQTEVAIARLALIRAQRTRRLAADRSHATGAALDGAVGQWLVGPPIRWPDLTVTPDSIGAHR